MKIHEYNEMMAWLKKPNRLFSSRKDTIGGGAIQGEDLGSRMGFAGPVLLKTGENKGKYKVRFRDPKFGKREGQSGFNEGDKFFATKEEADAFYQDLLSKKDEKQAAGLAKKNVAVEKQAKQINDFVNTFFDKNITNFDVRDYDKFKKALIKEFDESGIKSASGRQAKYKDLPNVGIKEAENYFKKLFYTNKINSDPDLQKRIGNYLKYYNTDKKFYGESQLDKEAKILARKQYADALENAGDVLFILGDDKVGNGKFRSGIVRQFFPEEMEIFNKKKQASGAAYEQKLAQIESRLSPEQLKQVLNGETSIKKFMAKQSDKLKEIFDLSTLDEGLKFNLDHAEGIAEIVKMENPDDIMRALKNLIGMTSARNYELGWRGYSTSRKNLLNNIEQGIDVDKNLKELNDLTKSVYPETQGKNAYKLVDGKVTPTKNFQFMYEPEKAFRQYFTELSTTEKGTEQLVKQAAEKPELLKFLQSIENNDFKNIGTIVDLYSKQKLELKGKLSDLYCGKKEGGRIGFADGPTGYACGIDEIQTNMKRDLQTPEGKSRVRGLLRGAGTILKNVVAPIDLAIESAFMLPSLLAGDPDAALNNTTLGLIPYFHVTGAEKAQKLLDKGLIDKNQHDEIIQGFKADEAVAGIAKNINDTDQLILGFTNIGILPDEKGEIKQSKASPERIAELTQNFGKKFIELAKERENLVAENQQYAPALKTAQGMSKTYNAFRQGLIKEATTTLSEQPFRENVGIREAIADIGKQLGTGEYLRKQKMQDPRFVVEGVGDPYFDYMNKYYSPYMEDVRSAFTGKDPRDRFADLPVSSPSALAQTELTEYKQGLAPFLENLYRTEGPKALEAFAEEQQIDLSQFPLKGVPPMKQEMKQGGRIQLANGGRLSFAEGPIDPKKRATLKKIGIGGGLTAAVGTGLINLLDLFKGGAKKGVVATKAAQSEAEKLFFDLVNAVKNKGIIDKLDRVSDFSRGGAYYEYKGVKVLEDGENIELQFTTDKGAPAVVEYRKPSYDVDPDAGTSYKVPGEFTNEGQEIARYGKDGDVDIDFENEIIDPIENVKKIIDD